MTNDDSLDGLEAGRTAALRSGLLTGGVRTATICTVGLLAFATPVEAASTAAAFCDTALAETFRNIFALLQLAGPLIGGVLAVGASVVTPSVRNAELKHELREVRDQAILYGVILAPLGTSIIRFLINDVVAGGTSCGF